MRVLIDEDDSAAAANLAGRRQQWPFELVDDLLRALRKASALQGST